ncbi:phage tail protein [Marinomonas mediterranea]|jgi:P2-like prophage tail protein X|uniref:Tail X family protein n=1 Tax=Marinomonas mediterranea (strain ATCC 700492 / JCM 21426 / NBRC 103028 / MMB-1) TaxID=717774 RepID=F2K239_MARM1|nr:tail protein X [Marinomonas mediterranea]ADZ91117.1 tail X family protein [Marinomonas mediterranea MMB-1]WCN13180.1 phage tail protein [Marinomonas mediterranea]WCN17249.1 phage tail protein [Marinomonas mediterranea MMB-1]
MKTIRSRDGDTISNILLLGLGRNDDEAEEALFEQNPGLEQHGPVLPAGVVIFLPTMPEKAPETVVNIWD